jgi:ferric-dicitrate binding protein FerR (iron transport regulator)
MKTPEHIQKLLVRHIWNDLSPQEDAELRAWRGLSEANERFFLKATDRQELQAAVERMQAEEDGFVRKVLEPYAGAKAGSGMALPISHLRLYKFLRVAAMIIILSGIFYMIMNIDIGGTPRRVQPKKDYRATVISPEGIATAVDDMKRGYADGRAAAERRRRKNEEPFFTAVNDPKAAADKFGTLHTPADAQYGLILPYDSRVWLNVSSSVKYPARYPDSPEIAVTGEVYIEVTTNQAAFSPFYVTVENMRLTATEGRFNIQANTADTVIVTAIDGTLRLTTGSTVLLLHPHEQLRSIHGRLTVRKDVDILKILAWKINWGKH